MTPYRVSSVRLRRQVSGLLNGQTEAPVRLEPILKGLGGETQNLPLEKDLSAILYQAEGRRAVVLNSSLSREGRRFALARQLGHLAMHKPREVRIDFGAIIDLKAPRKADLVDLEAVEACWFALELLLPYDWIRSDLGIASPEDEPAERRSTRLDLQDDAGIRDLALRYRVAPYLLMFRLATLHD